MIVLLLISCITAALAVLVHYEVLMRITLWIPQMRIKHQFRIVIGVVAALFAHTVEIVIYAYAYYLMHHAEKFGQLTSQFDGSLMDCIYYSFTVFTTLGFGDIEPVGHIRFLTGVESLTGLVLITWTASFLFIEMQRNWKL